MEPIDLGNGQSVRFTSKEQFDTAIARLKMARTEFMSHELRSVLRGLDEKLMKIKPGAIDWEWTCKVLRKRYPDANAELIDNKASRLWRSLVTARSKYGLDIDVYCAGCGIAIEHNYTMRHEDRCPVASQKSSRHMLVTKESLRNNSVAFAERNLRGIGNNIKESYEAIVAAL